MRILLAIIIPLVALAQPYEPVLLYDEVHSGLRDIVGLGDQDGDGFDDILISIPDANQSNSDFYHLRIVYGDENSPYSFTDFGFVDRDTTADPYYPQRAQGPSACGDYNSDNSIDMLIQYKYGGRSRFFYNHGGPSLFDTTWDWVADQSIGLYGIRGGLGDYDGDGRMDFLGGSLAIPASEFDFYSGAWPNLSAEPTWSYSPPLAEGHSFWGSFGMLFGQGDINGDGFADFAFPMWYDSIDGTPGTSFVLNRHAIWLGGPDAGSEPAIMFEHRYEGQWITGWEPVADVNGDGYDDMIAYLLSAASPQGVIVLEHYIFYGGDPIDLEQPDVILHPPEGWQPHELDTDRKARLGDINGDGYEDFAVYSSGWEYGYYIIYLGGDPPSGEVGFVIGPLWEERKPGIYISSAGDFNGDSIDDFAMATFPSPSGDLADSFRVTVIAGDQGFGLPVPEGPPVIAEDFHFGSPYPNPFNSSVSIPLELSNPQLVDIRIYNILGQQVYNYGRRLLLPGEQVLHWEGATNTGSHVSSGVYLITANTGQKIATTRVQLLR